MRSALRQRARKTGARLQRPSPMPPEPLVYLWNWFVALHAGCSSNASGLVEMTWRDLAAWADMTNCQPEPWETEVLMRLGALHLKIHGEKMKRDLDAMRKA